MEHPPEVGADLRAHVREHGDIAREAFLAFGQSVVQRQFAAEDAQLPGDVRPRAGRVEPQLVANRAAGQLVDRLAPQFAEQVPSARSTPEIALTTRPLRP